MSWRASVWRSDAPLIIKSSVIVHQRVSLVVSVGGYGGTSLRSLYFSISISCQYLGSSVDEDRLYYTKIWAARAPALNAWRTENHPSLWLFFFAWQSQFIFLLARLKGWLSLECTWLLVSFEGFERYVTALLADCFSVLFLDETDACKFLAGNAARKIRSFDRRGLQRRDLLTLVQILQV